MATITILKNFHSFMDMGPDGIDGSGQAGRTGADNNDIIWVLVCHALLLVVPI